MSALGWLLLIGITAASCCGAYWMASARGYPPRLWVVLAFLLGPFPLLVLALLPPRAWSGGAAAP